MEESRIKKINKAGKVGYVISVFLIIAAIVVMVGIGIFGVVASTILNEDVNVKVHTDININSKENILSKLDGLILIDGVDKLSSLVEDSEGVKINDNDISDISIEKDNNGGLDIDVTTNEKTIDIQKVFIALVTLFIFSLASTVTLHMVKRLMKELKNCETPFSEEVIKRMNSFAKSLVFTIILKTLLSGTWSSLTTEAEYDITINFGNILLVAVIYILIKVFKYGAELQKESDETL